MTNKNIVVVGAGFAGVAATKELAKKFKKNPEVTITLIDRHSYQTMMTELHEVAGGRVEPEAVTFDLRKLFGRQKNVQIVTDNVTDIDKENKVVHAENGSYEFDYVVISMGAESNDFGTPGVKEHGFTIWGLEDAIRIRDHIEATVAKAAVETDVEKRKALLTFVVCGSGFTGIELVGELVEWKDRLAKQNKISPDEFSLLVVEAAPTILNMLDRNDAGKAEAYLVKNGVRILKDAPIVEVAADHIKLKSEEIIPTYSLLWTAGVKATSDIDGFGLEQVRAKRALTNEFMEAKGFEGKGIFLAGDVSYFEEEEGKPTPQIVQAAEQTAHTAATNIVNEVNGVAKVPFKSNYQGNIVSIGSKYAVAFVFNKFHFSGFFASLLKYGSSMRYFLDIGSAYFLFQYLLHEFFRVGDNRSVFRGHTSRLGNVLWSVPLRILFGIFIFVNAKSLIGAGAITNFYSPYSGFTLALAPVVAALGLFITFGFFTSLSSIITIIWLLSLPGLNLTSWMYIFAALALMNGAGRAFGLDRWVIPFVHKKFVNAWYGISQSIYKKK